MQSKMVPRDLSSRLYCSVLLQNICRGVSKTLTEGMSFCRCACLHLQPEDQSRPIVLSVVHSGGPLEHFMKPPVQKASTIGPFSSDSLFSFSLTYKMNSRWSARMKREKCRWIFKRFNLNSTRSLLFRSFDFKNWSVGHELYFSFWWVIQKKLQPQL